MELHSAPRLIPGGAPDDRCARYLDRLPLGADRRRELLVRLRAYGTRLREAMTELHQALGGHPAPSDDPALASQRRRLDLAFGESHAGEASAVATDVHGRARLVTTPPLARASMAPPTWTRGWLARCLHPWRGPHIVGGGRRASDRRREARPPPESPDPQGAWHRAGLTRRITLLMLVIAQTVVATEFMTAVLPYHGRQPLEIVLLVLFAILFGWVSAGFWTAMAGFLLLLTGRDRFSVTRSLAENKPIDKGARTAIIMPICNEDVVRVFAGLRATYESLEGTGELAHFDFFVLSDTNDADARVAETRAWLGLCRAVDGFGRVFYRWRQHHIKRKSGNVADFCRRWGRNYRYMVVLDADSVMSGECLTALVRIAEANPTSGIIQTAPRAAGRDTLYARMQQFATRVYGPLFTAGLHFWQLGESHYWGHNAIIRVAPFMRHCALGRLPGRGSLSGEILSHDFVEAALMRRAGWAVWIAYDLPGSYEEMPPNLIDELKRDRRWCQGNLMNFRLFMMKGLHPAHRAVFMTGVMAYLSAPLWFAFLIVSTWLLAEHTLKAPTYFPEPNQLFPVWPEWHPEWAIALFSATATLLFLPKVFSMLLVGAHAPRPYGGGARLIVSTLSEMVLSALLAPIRMLFHTTFVVTGLLGLPVSWKSPPRDDAETTWREAIARHGLHTLFGMAWAAGVYWLNPSFLWWLLPIVGALILSIPLSVYTSSVTIGRRLRRARFFLIPEESRPPPEIRWTRRHQKRVKGTPGFVDAVVDPIVNALACATRSARSAAAAPTRGKQAVVAKQALVDGPSALTNAQKGMLLNDASALSRLHFEVWTADDAHDAWKEEFKARAALAQIIPLHRPAE